MKPTIIKIMAIGMAIMVAGCYLEEDENSNGGSATIVGGDALVEAPDVVEFVPQDTWAEFDELRAGDAGLDRQMDPDWADNQVELVDLVQQDVCTPHTCENLNVECGEWDDGCDGLIDCGACTQLPNSHCADDGMCNCQPETCETIGKNCGGWDNGCGAMLNCGDCPCWFIDDFEDGNLEPWEDLTAAAGYTATVEVDGGWLKLIRGSGDAAARVLFDYATPDKAHLIWEFDAVLQTPESRLVCSLLVEGDSGPVPAYTFGIYSAELDEHRYYFRVGGSEFDAWNWPAEPGTGFHQIRVKRAVGDVWSFAVDQEVFEPDLVEGAYDNFVGIYCNGAQHTHPGHGGHVDDMKLCFGDYVVPDCENKECGPDGAGGICGDCDDSNACTTESCIEGSCQTSLIDCNDNSACTIESCEPEQGCMYDEVDCNDVDLCTEDSCDADKGCVHQPIDCNDNSACTTESCDPEQGCMYEEIDCNDVDLCTEDSCDAGKGCVHQPIDCNDNSACTIESCEPEQGCMYEEIDCNDENECTVDICDPALGCVHNPVDCNDENACTINLCSATGGCYFNALDCDDGDACTIDACDKVKGCVHAPVDCNDANACTAETCDPVEGCKHQPVICDDADMCTSDSCHGGTGCMFVPVNCDDGSACTVDLCDPTEGCSHVDLLCDDHDACTDDSCDADSGCVHYEADCDDDDACTVDSCESDDGCEHVALACDDNDPCTVDFCDSSNGCVHSTIVCTDDNPCTDDMCQAGKCLYIPNQASCDDGNVCTQSDHCNNGVCTYDSLTSCDDGNVCTTEYCDSVAGCMYTINSAPCNDGSVCTIDDHCYLGECISTKKLACDDGSACTLDLCDPTTGCIHSLVDCDDNDNCTKDECDAAVGCVYEQVSVDDSNACTMDSCDPDGGVSHKKISCADGNPCTIDWCDSNLGCQHKDKSCDDNNKCTKDSCWSQFWGLCLHSKVSCDDGDPCTADSCDKLKGCLHTPVDCNEGIVFHLDFNDDESPLVDEIEGHKVGKPNCTYIKDSCLSPTYGKALQDAGVICGGVTVPGSMVELTPDKPWTVETHFAWKSGSPILYFRQGQHPWDSAYFDVVVKSGKVKMTDGSKSVQHPKTIKQGEWHHLAVVCDGSKNIKLFLDGVEAGSTYTAPNNWPKYNYVAFGHKHYLNANTPFTGWFDEFKIFSHAKKEFPKFQDSCKQ